LKFNDISLIRKIQGTKEGNNFRKLIFKRIDGSEEGRIETTEQRDLGAEEILATDECIIGVYGKYDNGDIDSLGLLVWKPTQV
jgi:hypothetical protein